MAKTKQARRLGELEALASLRSAKSSAQKARLVLNSIKGMSAEAALAELSFSTKGVAPLVKGVLESAIANAENNHDLNVDKLVVANAYADKSIVIKRWHARGRGRIGKILKPRCHITVVVAEREAESKQQTKGAA